eukprot:14319683-Ditylum_brightwellii.AAC.1
MRGVTIDAGGPIDKMMNTGRSFTAHPHVVDENTLVAFKSAQNPKTKDIELEFVEYDADWQEKKNVKYVLPKAPAPPHDF